MIPKTIIHLLSGGLDSVTMLYDLKQQGCNVHCLLVNYEQPHVQELTFARLHCHRLGVQSTTRNIGRIGGLDEGNGWIVHNRNMILLAHAASLAMEAKAECVTIACNKDDELGFADCRMAFMQMMNTTLTTGEIPVEICTPYIDWPKWKIAGLARELGVPTHEIWTCYKGGAKPCGLCPACLKLNSAITHK
jgi:7-cyano-7-deazaguanine synthase